MIKRSSIICLYLLSILIILGCSNRDYLLENRSKENKNVSYYYYAFNKETISIFPLLEKIKENNNIPIYIYEMDDPNNAARLKLRIFEVAIGNAYYFLIKKSNESSFFIFKINSLEIINLFEKSQLEKQRFQNGKPQEQQAFQSFLFKSKNCEEIDAELRTNPSSKKEKTLSFQCTETFTGTINSIVNDIFINKDHNIIVTGHKASYLNNILSLWNLEQLTQINFSPDNTSIFGVERRKYNSIDAIVIDEYNQFIFGYSKDFEEILIWNLSNGKLVKVKEIKAFRKESCEKKSDKQFCEKIEAKKYLIKLNPTNNNELEINYIFLENGNFQEKYTISYQYDCLPTDSLFKRLQGCECIKYNQEEKTK